MALCDRLEAARERREAARDRLAAASLARLNAPDPETFQADARFALDALPALTTRPDQIKALRQTILNLAVRGKLVPQDPNDEPASELLKRIAAEKARLVREGKLTLLKGEPPAIRALSHSRFRPTGRGAIWTTSPLLLAVARPAPSMHSSQTIRTASPGSRSATRKGAASTSKRRRRGSNPADLPGHDSSFLATFFSRTQ